MADIVYAIGAVDNQAGPVASFVGMTQEGRDWIDAYGSEGRYLVETHMADYTVACIESDGLIAEQTAMQRKRA